MTTGEKIKTIRKKRGLTQRELAEKLGTTPQNLAQYENNKRNPKYWTLQNIAEALQVNIKELLPDSDYNDLLGDKAALAYSTVLEQIIGLRGYTFDITEDTDELYVYYPDGILKLEDGVPDKLLEEIESFADFKMHEIRKQYAHNFIPKRFFDYKKHITKPEYYQLQATAPPDRDEPEAPNAANDRGATPEEKKNADDIMHNPDEWE